MIADAKFLIKQGAFVSVYDLRSEARLKSQLIFLRSIGLANYFCGSIPADDLIDMDIIILSHEYPRESSCLKLAAEKGVVIEYPETLFFKQAPPVTLVGVMGSCGKATVVSMLAPMLDFVCDYEGGPRFFSADPESSEGILTHLRKIRSGDIVLIRIVEGMMRELAKLRVSPHFGVYTTLPPKNSYDNSPFDILAYQTYNNYIIGNDEVIDSTHSFGFQPKAKMLRTKASLIPADWKFGGQAHDRDNAALALQVARLFKIDDEIVRNMLERWRPLKGRVEFVKKVKGVEFYNDSASISPDSTIAGMASLSSNRNILLIFGGADGGSEYRRLYETLSLYARMAIVVPGSGTLKERRALSKIEGVEICSVPSIEEAARIALEGARAGDKVLFSPGFAAGGVDASRRERGERFVRAIRAL